MAIQSPVTNSYENENGESESQKGTSGASHTALTDESGNVLTRPVGNTSTGVFEAISDADTPSGSTQIVNSTGGIKALNVQLDGSLGTGEFLVIAYSYQASDDATVIAQAQAASIEFSGTLAGTLYTNIIVLTDAEPSRSWLASGTDYIKTLSAVNSKDNTGATTINYELEATLP